MEVAPLKAPEWNEEEPDLAAAPKLEPKPPEADPKLLELAP